MVEIYLHCNYRQKISLKSSIFRFKIAYFGGNSFKKQNIYENIKTQSKIVNSEAIDTDLGDTGKIKADVQSNKLKQLLGQIKAQ